MDEATQAKIAFLLLPGVGTKDDLRQAAEAGASVCRIATHCTEADISIQHFGWPATSGMETVGFLMMAHRPPRPSWPGRPGSWSTPAPSASTCVDSAGALVLDDARTGSGPMYAEIGDEAQVGFHGHQNLALGVANSVLACQGGRRRSTARCARSAPGRATPPPRCWPPPSTSSACQTGRGRRGVLAAAEEVVRPFLPALAEMDRSAIVQG